MKWYHWIPIIGLLMYNKYDFNPDNVREWFLYQIYHAFILDTIFYFILIIILTI